MAWASTGAPKSVVTMNHPVEPCSPGSYWSRIASMAHIKSASYDGCLMHSIRYSSANSGSWQTSRDSSAVLPRACKRRLVPNASHVSYVRALYKVFTHLGGCRNVYLQPSCPRQELLDFQGDGSASDLRNGATASCTGPLGKGPPEGAGQSKMRFCPRVGRPRGLPAYPW